jgi:transcriptional regulator with XRE-family HTH domain
MPPEAPPAWWRRALTRALDSVGGNASELERRTGIARQTIQNWESGANAPNVKTIAPLMDYVDSLGVADPSPTYGVDEHATLAKIVRVLHDAGFDAPPAPAKKRKGP